MAALTAPIVGGKGTVELEAHVWGVEAHRTLLHEMVRAEGLERRQGTHETKTRARVAGGAAKPWRQKGTGRARQGTTRAPQWKGGGVVFGPHARDHSVKVNRKAQQKARVSALSQHARLGTLGVFDGAAFTEPKTKDAVKLLTGFTHELPLVVLIHEDELAAAMSFRNFERTIVATGSDIGVTELLWARSLLISSAALSELQGAFQ